MNYISLGYFCSIALDLDKLGLRAASYPFDWLITDFEGVINCMKNNFKDFLNVDFLYQNTKRPYVYKNIKYNFEFYHDFSRHKPLKNQLVTVNEKYKRRTQRFYDSIKEETIFIRYISDEIKINGKSKELIYIEENYDSIVQFLKSFNKKNEIIFIGNEGLNSSIINVYNVKKDKGDKVSRSPLIKIKYFKELFVHRFLRKVNKNKVGFFKHFIMNLSKTLPFKTYKPDKKY